MEQDKPRILVVDDEPIALQNLEHIMLKEGYQVLALDSGVEAIKHLEKTEFDIVLTDLKMQPIDGLQVLEHAKQRSPDTEVILITAYATVDTAVEAMKKGAYHYISKPFKLDEVRHTVRTALEKRQLKKEVSELRAKVKEQAQIPMIIGKSAKMLSLQETIRQIAPTDCNVLILGETGTGKELVARAIHQLSPRAEKRFLAFNCGAFSEELLANELFGHEKEAFTGARGVKKGLLEAASGGTVLLDEIGDMPLSMQVKLLRVLQEKKLIRVGGTEEIPADIRVLAATNKDLRKEVRKRTFRQDLYYRLNVITLEVPALTERRDDIPLLAHHFLKKFADAQNKDVEKISDEVMDILMAYEFPGNVRELENIIERAVVLCEGDTVQPKHLPPDLQQFTLRVHRPRQREFLTLEDQEKEYISWVLRKTKGNKTKAAEILGIDRVSLWRKLKKYKLEEP
ncbi:MAG: sigma-54-dependent Fis family transcriptional regulator [Deltaproteobacteria bacterium]|nr:sigma-54-dependent Fis family transcriptional regulator [Deltaproteobacteria bacterium]MBW2083885.1 sigma-54-dependent Fis family transcriptional regulator [Deltaproteobacteria bacterium]